MPCAIHFHHFQQPPFLSMSAQLQQATKVKAAATAYETRAAKAAAAAQVNKQIIVPVVSAAAAAAEPRAAGAHVTVEQLMAMLRTLPNVHITEVDEKHPVTARRNTPNCTDCRPGTCASACVSAAAETDDEAEEKESEEDETEEKEESEEDEAEEKEESDDDEKKEAEDADEQKADGYAVPLVAQIAKATVSDAPFASGKVVMDQFSATVNPFDNDKKKFKRDVFVMYVFNFNTGELVYGASIYRHEPGSFPLSSEALYTTAALRLAMRPVRIVIEGEGIDSLDALRLNVLQQGVFSREDDNGKMAPQVRGERVQSTAVESRRLAKCEAVLRKAVTAMQGILHGLHADEEEAEEDD